MSPRFVQFAVPLALLLTPAGCEDPAKDKPKATVSSATPPAATNVMATRPAAAPASGAALPIDASASTISFVGSKVTGKHEGKITKFEGSVTLAAGKPEGGSVKLELDLDSLKTDSEKLDGHLKSPDFFDVQKTPKATFSSTEIKPGGEKGATHTITGELALHGVKKAISFPATIKVAPDAITATSEFSINRKDFGIVYAGMKDDLIRDEVLITISLKVPQKP